MIAYLYRVILPELTHVRFVVSYAGIIHYYACNALGIKMGYNTYTR
ncbi:MAG: hypothetical protein EOP34_08725 [Rickettsiales bacterium]|nr:MAG: hypothetical protein EOP34_08725 [Rickettsiales bacterium]